MRDVTEAYRLSPQQARVWELRQAPRERGAYLAQCLARLEGALDAGALDAALRQVVERQEILRTTFGRTHGLSLPFQLIQDAGAPDFRRGELDGLPPAEREAALGQLCGEELRAPFDFERGPLLRALLVRLAAEEHALILTLPSLCADTWTLQNLVRELAQAYDASLGGERLTDEPLRYVQYSEWQNGLLEEDEEAEAGREFWRKQSQAAAPDARLPFEKIPEGDEPFVPTIFFSELGPEAVARVGETARKYRTTAEVVLLGCFHLLLHRLTSAPQTVASVSSDGRHFDELRGALGPLARSLPVAARHAART
ncbi:MAG TPA: condensation domain-containing protein, partial [Pyrinomonadaceae bacterium]|nr:condensation domain-containing protein [Pyrinomonadaceae bacterium]